MLGYLETGNFIYRDVYILLCLMAVFIGDLLTYMLFLDKIKNYSEEYAAEWYDNITFYINKTLFLCLSGIIVFHFVYLLLITEVYLLCDLCILFVILLSVAKIVLYITYNAYF